MARDQCTFATAASSGSEMGIERIVSTTIDVVVGFERLVLTFMRRIRVDGCK